MITRIIVSVVVAVVTSVLLVALVGPILVGLHTHIVDTIGEFCIGYGWLLGVAAGIWFYFKGSARYPWLGGPRDV